MKYLPKFPTMLLALALCVLSFAAQQSSRAAQESPLKVVSSTTESLVIEFTPLILRYDTIIASDGTLTITPVIEGCHYQSSAAGSPMQIAYSTVAAVPSPQGFYIAKIEAMGVKRIKSVMTPSPSLVRDGELTESRYNINSSAYATAKTAPWATAKYGGIARSIMTTDISITAARYDAASESIEIPGKIRVTLNFTGGTSVNVSQSSGSDLPSFVLNSVQAARWNIGATSALSKKTPDVRISGNGKYAKVTVETEGIYRISASDLAKYGIGTSASEASTIKLFGTGGNILSEAVPDNYTAELAEQPLIVHTNPDGSVQEILFYASGASGFERNGSSFRHFVNTYSKTNSYILTSGGTPGLRATVAPVPSEQPLARPTTYTARIFNEEEVFNAFDSKGYGSGTAWFGRKIDGSATFTTPLPNLVREGKTFFRYSIAHRNNQDGTCTVSENGNLLNTLDLYGCDPLNTSSYTDAYSSNRGDSILTSLLSQDNRSILKFSYKNSAGAVNSEAYFDWFEIHYPRECVANNNEIELFTNPTLSGVAEYSINGFSSGAIGFDVTDRRNPILLQNTSMTGGLFVYKSEFVLNAPRRIYISSTLKSPIIEQVELADLTSKFANTDVILITHKDLLESAQKYKQYRDSTGLSVSIVTTEQIYNEFAGGMPDISALRNFVGFALQNWQKKPRFLLLWGDSHFDFKNIQTPLPNYVPTHQEQSVNPDKSVQIYDGTLTIAGDDFFARATGNDSKVDIAVGRIPVNSSELGSWMVDKIKLYESNSTPGEWQTTATLIADDGPTGHGDDGTEHSSNSEIISASCIPNDIIQRKIYMAEYAIENLPGGRRKPGVTQEYLNVANNNGTVLMNFVGHGSPRVWAHELIFERETTVPQFTNLKKLFFLTAPTCDFGRFDDPNRNSGAEDLIFSKIGGAIGVFAATRPVYSTPNLNITKALYNALFSRIDGKYTRLGEAIYSVKQTLTEDNDQKFVMLADPTMRLLLPEYTVRIDSINGQATTSDTSAMPLIKALSRVVMQASIIRPENQAVEESFNGRAIVTMTDSDVKDEVVDPSDGIAHSIIRPSGILNRSSFAVTGGKFTATIVVPKDISFSNKQGRLFAFAVDSGKTAKGDTRSFRVGGIEDGSFDDISGPDISISLDARTFRPGELVRKSPLLIVDLVDDTGINTTGMGIGHKIEAWFDSNPTPIDLTDAFQTSVEDSRKGSAEKQIFNLASGNHTVRVRAWDVLNNYSETQTYFRTVASDNELILDSPLAYPNPASNSTTLTFTHNQSQPIEVEFSIFAVDGRLVRRLTTTVNSLHTGAVVWDCRNDDGDFVAQGAYTFSAVVTDHNGTTKQIAGMLQVSR